MWILIVISVSSPNIAGDIEMQEFSSRTQCQRVGQLIDRNFNNVEWRCESKDMPTPGGSLNQ